MAKADLTAQRLREVLHYDPETGAFTWRVGLSYRGKAGSVAGTIGPLGYCLIGIAGTKYLAHRLAWLYVHGVWPANYLDHIDGRRDSNRIGNLRDVNQSVNLQNIRSAHRDSVTGLLGVSRHRDQWDASISVRGARHRLGRFDTPEEAHAAYMTAKRKLHEGCTI